MRESRDDKNSGSSVKLKVHETWIARNSRGYCNGFFVRRKSLGTSWIIFVCQCLGDEVIRLTHSLQPRIHVYIGIITSANPGLSSISLIWTLTINTFPLEKVLEIITKSIGAMQASHYRSWWSVWHWLLWGLGTEASVVYRCPTSLWSLRPGSSTSINAVSACQCPNPYNYWL